MLKTNSKKARENIRRYIINNFCPEGYTDSPPTEAAEIMHFIYKCFREQKYSTIEDYRYYNNEQAAFIEWCAGLPSILDTCYYYNRSAVDDLGAILEESESEKARYSQRDAEQLLSKLIYYTIKKEI